MGTQNTMPPKPIKRVTVEFFDGTVETHELPEDQGFIREDFTWEPKPEGEGLTKWGTKIKTFKITWAVLS